MSCTEKVGLCSFPWLAVAIRKLQLYFCTLRGSFLPSSRLQSLTKYKLSTTSILQNNPSLLLIRGQLDSKSIPFYNVWELMKSIPTEKGVLLSPGYVRCLGPGYFKQNNLFFSHDFGPRLNRTSLFTAYLQCSRPKQLLSSLSCSALLLVRVLSGQRQGWFSNPLLPSQLGNLTTQRQGWWSWGANLLSSGLQIPL